jgi:hypothetical protein
MPIFVLMQVIRAASRSFPVTCLCLVLLVTPPRSAGSGIASVTIGHQSVNDRRTTETPSHSNRMTSRSPIVREQRSLSMPSRRDCLPVSRDALWIRLNVAEPPPHFNLPSPSTGFRSSKRGDVKRRSNPTSSTSRVVADVDSSLRSRAVPERSRARRDADHGTGKPRRRTKTSTSVPPPLTTTTTSIRRKIETETDSRRRTTVTVNVSDNVAVTQTTLSSFRSKPRFRSKTTHPYVTSTISTLKADRPAPHPPEVDTEAYSDDGEDAMAAVFRQTSWQCRAEPYWRRMPAGTFPPYVQTARCRQSRCMLGLYECVAKRYGIKVLRRVDGRCLPVPLVVGSVNATVGGSVDDAQPASEAGGLYEQAWTFAETQVTVGCECTRRRHTGSYYELPVSRTP